MKILGRVDPEYDGDKVVNADYVGGRIAALTEREAYTLRLLQSAVDGQAWDWKGVFLIWLTDLRECLEPKEESEQCES